MTKMDLWTVMFREVREIVRLTDSWGEGVTRAAALARRRSDLFDESEYWDRVKLHDFCYSFDIATHWAKKGFEKVEAKVGWETLLLELGDCPETFRMALHGTELDDRLAPEVNKLLSSIPYMERVVLAEHSVEELDDEILTWNGVRDTDYYGDNGYFLWLVIGSLALMRPLWDAASCKNVLQGRERLYLLSGFEGMYTYLATVTSEGFIYEYKDLPPISPYVIKPQLSGNGNLLQGILLFEQSDTYGWEPFVSMNEPTNDAGDDLSPQTSHPRAAEILQAPFFFDCTDEFSPLGNDTGADTLSFYRKWRPENPDTPPIVFLDDLLASWGCMNAHWDSVDSVEIQRLIRKDEFGLLVRDDTIIGLAFAQLIVEGTVDDEIKRRALTAIRRQGLPAMIEFRDWTLPRQRLERLAAMRVALEAV